LAVRTLVAQKGIEPVVLNVTEFCSFTDYFIICSGGSSRHVLALAQHVEAALSQAGIKPMGAEGREGGQWVLIDYNIMVIHIFLEPLREFYNLEDLWSDAPQIRIDPDSQPQLSSLPAQEHITDPDTDSESTPDE
jgi:ribosome-associated protein